MVELNTFCPSDASDFREWLKHNHKTKKHIWIIFFKQSSPTPNLSWSEAVDQALCFGWIDSTKRARDKQSYMQRYTPRKPKSVWSRINKLKVEALTKSGQMTEEGLAAVKRAKTNGSWFTLDSCDALEVPIDLETAFAKHPGSKAFYLSLSPSKRRGLLSWVAMAKRDITKEKRIKEIVKAALERRRPSHFVM
eukprot:gnl/Dysnectes_brevis/6136_a9275_543.p1 GENE.gnl/Dysnectes_brevis/6136_a9275_543~~gnl/Dysnectes_brevis/6136_a9275_543.p1  ORF type:complete len:193 (+),score=15.05 gnl/Dysnectes_brevis/6136_a9275_543:31-609(+)